MYHSQTKLPHLLSPQDYVSQQAHERDAQLLRQTWHVVATTNDLNRDGQFITINVVGMPVQVRNFRGKLRALSNVCAHRHALICSAACGRSETMRCQYHGWEYQADGSTGKIPEPKNFAPIDRQQLQLPVYAVETLGQLVFLNVGTQPAVPLRDFLGTDFYELLAKRFSEQWKLSLRWQSDYAANWKVPVENSLESYHVPAVHPSTFRRDPGSDDSEHGLLSNRTWFRTNLPFCPHSNLDKLFQRVEGTVVSWLGHPRHDKYEQHHLFPNLLFSFTDAISLCQCVLPSSVNRSRATVFQFGRLPEKSAWKRWPAGCWSHFKGMITRYILKEDMNMFAAIQQGLEASPHQGVLGICEERIHRFQEFLLQRRPR